MTRLATPALVVASGLALIATTRCSLMADPALETYRRALILEVIGVKGAGAGSPNVVDLKLSNRGDQLTAACIGASRSISIGSASSLEFTHHTGCVRNFELAPGAQLVWRETFDQAPTLSNDARLEVSILASSALGYDHVMTASLDDRLHTWIARHQRVFALTGAGCSTASGIPDYRDDEGAWKRRQPVMIQAFRAQHAVYRRYWARAYAGWPRLAAAAPNDAHRAFAVWEEAGTLVQVVTQNVDRLHQRAGSRAVLDLHGRLDIVVCVDCGERTARADVQSTIAAENPGWRTHAATAPDGDADIDDDTIESFVAPRCERCGGLLKPDVVFFGENVPRDR